jgi:tripartite-type tricarboxylate transporter receptor subunit TctC
MKTFIRHAFAALTFGFGAAASHADSFPSKPIKLIVPYAVGQGTDIAARYVADQLGKEIKQTVFVENRPGAGGNIGTQVAATSPADGYTLVIGTNATHAANEFLYQKPGYKPEDFEPIGMVGILPLVFVAGNNSPITDMQGLVRAAREKPQKLDIAVTTTTCRMAYELFSKRASAPMFTVDYKGSGEALTGVMGGQLEFMVDTITSLRSAIANKQVKALGVTSGPQQPAAARREVAGRARHRGLRTDRMDRDLHAQGRACGRLADPDGGAVHGAGTPGSPGAIAEPGHRAADPVARGTARLRRSREGEVGPADPRRRAETQLSQLTCPAAVALLQRARTAPDPGP